MSKIAGGMHEPTGMRGDLRLYTNNGTGLFERMRIDADGHVGIGTGSPANTLSVFGITDFQEWVGIGTTTPYAHLDITSANPQSTWLQIKNSLAGQRYYLQVDGTSPPDAGVMKGDEFSLTGGFWFEKPPGDCNSDGGVNLIDYADFDDCLSGPEHGLPTSACNCFDFDNDSDVDLSDVARFQVAFRGG